VNNHNAAVTPIGKGRTGRGARLLSLLTLALVAVLLTACVNDSDDDSSPSTLVHVGDAVPAFTLQGSDGTAVTKATMAGQAYVLNFFDTGCPDCRQELKVLQQVYDKYEGMVTVLNVPRSQTADQVQAYWDNAGLTMPYHIPADKDLYYKFADRIVPRTFVVDANGNVQAAFADSPVADYSTLVSLLQRLHSNSTTDADSVNVALQLRLRAPKGNGMEEFYFHNEYTISRLDAYFFNAETKEFVTKMVIRNLTQADDLWDTEYDITYLYEDLRLKADIYDIFLIANYDYAPDVVTDESEFLNMVDSTTYKDGIEANIPDKGPVMTSRATSLLNIDLIPWVNRDYVLRVEMERVIAKLQIGVAKNTFNLVHDRRKYADINITNYKLVNLNTRYYLFQHTDSMPKVGQPPQFVLPTNFCDCTEHGDNYVVDPLFYLKAPNTASVVKFREYYKSWFGDFNTDNFASMPSAENSGYAYILENTAVKTSQKNGYSPGVIFKAAVSPVFVFLYDESVQALKEEYRPEYWPNTIYLYNYNFYESIRALNVASGLMLDELETYSDERLKAFGIKQCKFNMGVYETYYTYWIRHRSNSTDNMGPMQYGIVRNNYYKMQVTGINGIGNSTITPDILRDNYPNSYADVTVSSNY
jgi:peroxiredoxin